MSKRDKKVLSSLSNIWDIFLARFVWYTSDLHFGVCRILHADVGCVGVKQLSANFDLTVGVGGVGTASAEVVDAEGVGEGVVGVWISGVAVRLFSTIWESVDVEAMHIADDSSMSVRSQFSTTI